MGLYVRSGPGRSGPFPLFSAVSGPWCSRPFGRFRPRGPIAPRPVSGSSRFLPAVLGVSGGRGVCGRPPALSQDCRVLPRHPGLPWALPAGPMGSPGPQVVPEVSFRRCHVEVSAGCPEAYPGFLRPSRRVRRLLRLPPISQPPRALARSRASAQRMAVRRARLLSANGSGVRGPVLLSRPAARPSSLPRRGGGPHCGPGPRGRR